MRPYFGTKLPNYDQQLSFLYIFFHGTSIITHFYSIRRKNNMSGCKTRNLQCKITSQLHSTRPLMTTGAKPFKKSWTLMTIASFWWTKGVAEEVIDGRVEDKAMSVAVPWLVECKVKGMMNSMMVGYRPDR